MRIGLAIGVAVSAAQTFMLWQMSTSPFEHYVAVAIGALAVDAVIDRVRVIGKAVQR